MNGWRARAVKHPTDLDLVEAAKHWLAVSDPLLSSCRRAPASVIAFGERFSIGKLARELRLSLESIKM